MERNNKYEIVNSTTNKGFEEIVNMVINMKLKQ